MAPSLRPRKLQKTGESSAVPTSAAAELENDQQTTFTVLTPAAAELKNDQQTITASESQDQLEEDPQTDADAEGETDPEAEFDDAGEDEVEYSDDPEAEYDDDSEAEYDDDSESEADTWEPKTINVRTQPVGTITWPEFRVTSLPDVLELNTNGLPTYVTIDFADDGEKCYAFTVGFITKLFAYIKSALEFGMLAGEVYAPGQSKHFHLYDIPETVFRKILGFAAGATKFQGQYWAESVRKLLHTIIAVDFLRLGDVDQKFAGFEDHIAECLAYAFIIDRLKVTPAVLLLVSSHPVYKRGLIWDVCVKAAVRVDLQEKKNEYNRSDWCSLYGDESAVEYRKGQENTWAEIREHYDELRRFFPAYDNAVEEAIDKTLDAGELVEGPFAMPEVEDYDVDTNEWVFTDPLFNFLKNASVARPLREFTQEQEPLVVQQPTSQLEAVLATIYKPGWKEGKGIAGKPYADPMPRKYRGKGYVLVGRSLFTGDRVKLVFSNDDTEYTFAKDFLTIKFEYFEKALKRWTEGQEQVVRFDHITVQTFASIHKWCKITYWGWGMDLTERKLEHLFKCALAADYLAMRAYEPFEAWLNEGIALTLFEDRTALTQDLLDLVAGTNAHPRFGQSCLFWKTFIAAGVRPAMQDHMRFQQDKTSASAPACGSQDGYAAWDEALAYCSRLRKRQRNAHYAAAVLREINVTMREGRHQWQNWGWAAGPRGRSWQVFDPLCEVIVSEAESPHVFARLIKYVFDPGSLQSNNDDWVNMEHEDLDNLFTLVIAADYLRMNIFADLEEKVAERVALTLLGDRRALSSAHINRLASYNAFRSKLLWEVVMESGVRPILQEHLIEEYDPNNPHDGQWAEQLKHCQQLRAVDLEYAHGVAQRISNTLKREEDGKYPDPLIRFISFDISDDSDRFKKFAIDWAF
ncbi:hypothetical protein GE09DRAFT_1212651 [Coniochaeta sp. 2T2.1]|nr:hypothetical protein GE09DRAFT_1212651 [Coniochaeta sp. 2T2.1]